MKNVNPVGIAVGWLAALVVAVALAWLFGFIAPNMNVIFFFAVFLVAGYLIGMTYEKLCGKPGIARILLLIVAIPLFVFISQEVYINTLYRVGQDGSAYTAELAHNAAMNNPDLHITLNIVLGLVLAALGGAASSVKDTSKAAAPEAVPAPEAAPAPAPAPAAADAPKPAAARESATPGAPTKDTSAFM